MDLLFPVCYQPEQQEEGSNSLFNFLLEVNGLGSLLEMDPQQLEAASGKDEADSIKPSPPSVHGPKPLHRRDSKPSLSIMAALRKGSSQRRAQPSMASPQLQAQQAHGGSGSLQNLLQVSKDCFLEASQNHFSGEEEESSDENTSGGSGGSLPHSVSFSTASNPNLASTSTLRRGSRKRSLPEDCVDDDEVDVSSSNNYTWSRIESPPHNFHPDELPVAASLVDNFELMLSSETEDEEAYHPDNMVLPTRADFVGANGEAIAAPSPLPSTTMTTPSQQPAVSGPATSASPRASPTDPDLQKAAAGQNSRSQQNDQWNERFQELCEFRKVKGHPNVPHNYKGNPRLARWVKRQRHQYKLLKEEGRSLSASLEERVKALTDIGFVWDCQRTAWDEKLTELKEYKETYGHTNVPSNFPSNPQLAMWVKCQRRQYRLYKEGKKSSSMSTKRIEELEKLGFVWGMRGTQKRARTEHSA